ncbi:MAG: sigma-70 family RNA polymerase sigma factor [Chthoniobacterales bacterium]|nr:sigma-70 family RNA polymerase sigma factor [Chthoniobacterales bacterium]
MSSLEEEVSDNDLVAKTKKGDSSAFDDLIRKYHGRLYGLIYHMTSNHEDTNDLLQDVFSKTFQVIATFKGESSFYTWIHRIAVNMTLNFLKKRNRRQHSSLDNTEEHLENDPDFLAEANKKDPRHLINMQEFQKKLTVAMDQLSGQHRAVVTLFDIQGISQSEIAKILKTTEGTVRSRLFYAHQQLKTSLQEFNVK